MQLADCAREAGVSPDMLRHYVRIGVVRPEARAANGYRMFSTRSVARVRFVRAALGLGFRLKDVEELVKLSERGELPCPRARAILRERIEQRRTQLEAMEILYRRMKRALDDWQRRPDGVPDGHSVCGLIEGTPEFSDRARPRRRVVKSR